MALVSRFQVKHVNKSGDSENLHQFVIDMPDRESPADAGDPLLEADQPAQGGAGHVMNVGQIKNQVNAGSDRHRVEESIQVFAVEPVARRCDDIEVGGAFPGKPEQVPASRARRRCRRIGRIDLELRATDVASVRLNFRCI